MIRKAMIVFAYQAMTTLAIPLVLLILSLRSLNHPQYRKRLGERLGLGPKVSPGGIVIHGASVGEIASLSPLISLLRERHPRLPMCITAFTPTGSAQVIQRFAHDVDHRYLPIDSPACVNSFLNRVRPKLVVLMETELWPNLIASCHDRGIQIILINARISQRSYPRYQKIRSLIATTLAQLTCILAQSQSDAERLIHLGAQTQGTHVYGNLKYDIVQPSEIAQKTASLNDRLADRRIWVVGSSHADEEELLFEALDLVRRATPESLLILAPRHPERYQALRDKAEQRSLCLVSRSEGENTPSPSDAIWLVDTMGELLLFYSIADVCVIAGSLGSTGGHNPLEAALFSKPIIVGPNTKNFEDATQSLLEANGLIQLQIASPEALANAVIEILNKEKVAKTLGTNAHRVLQQNRGATEATLTKIEALLSV